MGRRSGSQRHRAPAGVATRQEQDPRWPWRRRCRLELSRGGVNDLPVPERRRPCEVTHAAPESRSRRRARADAPSPSTRSSQHESRLMARHARSSPHRPCGRHAYTHTRRGRVETRFRRTRSRGRRGALGAAACSRAAGAAPPSSPAACGPAPAKAPERLSAASPEPPAGLRSRSVVASRTRCGAADAGPSARAHSGSNAGAQGAPDPAWLRLAARSPGPRSPRAFATCRATS